MRLSPPELSYLYTSLTSNPPIRPDLRSLTQYRPYSIQTDFLPTANGSARITWGAGQEGGDVLVVIKAQIEPAVEMSKGVYSGKLSVDMSLPIWISSLNNSACSNSSGGDGDEDSTAFLVQSLTSLLIPLQSSSYGIDLRSLVITETKAWHVWIDCVV
jgi:exosome complex RNA-binding protein Rrp42 (RNase PH superfamily)